MDGQGQAKTASSNKRRILRQATVILPSTGKRVRRDFTLRDPKLCGPSSNGQANGEREPLLPKATVPTPQGRVERLKAWTGSSWRDAYEFSKTTTAQAILKCSLAYLIATSFTFFTPFSSVLGTHQDGNQLIANVVVWFDPSRSVGSMLLGICLALLAFLYGSFVAFSAQGVAAAFDAAKLIIVGHVVDLLLFCWGGLGLIAWFKQYMGHPLINTATSLASLAVVTCLTKEGVVQTGDFSYFRVTQILKMLITGIIVSSAINLIVWPVSARKNLSKGLWETTNAIGDLMTTITASFLAGSEEDLHHPTFVAAFDNFKKVLGALAGQLAEARYEHYVLGTERQYHIEKRLVRSMHQLAQDMGGLRSAAATEFALLAEDANRKGSVVWQQYLNAGQIANDSDSREASEGTSDRSEAPKRLTGLQSSDQSDTSSEEERRASVSSYHQTLRKVKSNAGSAQSPSQVLDIFIEHLGPPMKSLAYTLSVILKGLPFGSKTERAASNLPKFRNSLTEAIKLFQRSRAEALDLVYLSKEMSIASSIHVAADFEEVAASCGHFSSSLEDFAETCLAYLDILDDLEVEVDERQGGRSWSWLRIWRYGRRSANGVPRAASSENVENGTVTPPTPPNEAINASMEKPPAELAFPYWLYPYCAWFRREDIKFFFKVGGGATFYATFAFIPWIKPYYDHWHLEWGLVSYMLVCSMSLGTSNTTAWSRFFGTMVGAVSAIVVWLVCQENPYALAFCGWLVSLVCFYLNVAKGQGPMSRFILLTYNLSVLYSYALTMSDPEAPGDEKEDDLRKTIFEVASHRLFAVLLGVFGGLFVTHYIWPISARAKLKTGLSLLWLRMSLIWKRAPLTLLVEGKASAPAYKDIRTETALREYLDSLDKLRKSAAAEFHLKGPFPAASFEALVKSTGRMLDAFHALNVVISKDLKASPGEKEILEYTALERDEVALRMGHMLSVLAASLNMEYPLNDTLPKITSVRDRFLAKIFECRQSSTKRTEPTDQDYELFYCYGEFSDPFALVIGQIAKEVDISGRELEKLYGQLGEKVLKLQ